MNPEKIGKFICELRKEQNLSQYQLADMIPISRQGVSKWERGKTTPDTQTLIRLSEIFHVSINELLKGERLLNNSIEELEETTLSILDQSNKKTKTIKRITTISISIITTLLLAFLSYYFINSYNTIEVYTIFGQSKNFSTAEGIFIITKEKYYFKLGKLKNKTNAEIENVELYYKLGNKKVVLSKDRDMDDVTIIDSYGYKEKLTKNDINELKNNIYLKITYNEKETSIVKLKFKRDYKNSRLFFINQKVGENKVKDNTTNQEEIRQVDEKKEEEVKPTIKEITTETKKEEKKTENKESKPKEENKTQEATKEEPKQEDKPSEEPQSGQEQQPEEPEEPQQPEETVITTEMVTNKIKEVCSNTNGTYTCEYDNAETVIMYYSIMNKITIYKNKSLIGNYFINFNNYACIVDNCETIFDETFKEYLFS